MIYEVSADDILDYTEECDSNIRPGTLEDAISFSDSILSNPRYLQISDVFLFSEYSLWSYGVRNESISDTITFSDSTIPRSYAVTISDFLILQDIVESPLGGVISEILTFSETIVGNSGTLVTDNFTFSDTTVVVVFADRTVSESITLSDHMSVAAITPTILDLPPAYTPPSEATTISLQDNVETLSILNPDFGDSDTIDYKRINKTSRGYTPIITGIAGWLPKSSKKMTFSYLQESEANKIKRFWSRNVGRPVTLVDMYGTSYNVILQNPEFEVAQVGRENRTLTMDFYVL